MQATLSTIVVGSGVFGAASALELVRRGHSVKLFDPGPVPHPLASSTDISKVIRMDYGSDDLYLELMEEAFEGWDAWNALWVEPLYHEAGFTIVTAGQMEPGSFEYEGYRRLLARGHSVERLDSSRLVQRFPEWNGANYADGYFNPRAGWAESGRVTAWLAGQAAAEGGEVYQSAFGRFLEDGSRVRGIVTAQGDEHSADSVVLAAGAWTPTLLPETSDLVWATGQPVVHLRAPEPSRFQPPRFSCWAADISRTGWYGFPATADGTFKIGHHGPGRRVHPDEPREVGQEHLERCREFLHQTFPSLVDAPAIQTRLCLYCDSWDGNFYIDRHPDRPGLVVAAGDSGHGFKFAPVLGGLVADAVEGRQNRFSHRFAWRQRGELAAEDARFTGQ